MTPSLSGASETFIRDLILGLAKQGGQLTIACGDSDPPIDFEIPPNVAIKTVPYLALTRLSDRLKFRLQRNKQEWSGSRDTLFDINAMRYLGQLADEETPDIAYVEFGWTLARSSNVFFDKGIPVIAHVHGADLTTYLNLPGYSDALERGFHDAQAVIAASHHMRRLAILAGASPEKIHVIRLGVSIEDLEPMSWRKRRMSNPSIVFLGRMVAKKNPVALIEAFARVKAETSDVTLNMIGDGPERTRAEERALQLGVESSVIWHGELNRRAALEIVRENWIYAQHSVTPYSGDQEGFGISIAEASALELPVVSTYHNGIPEQILHGENGYLVQEYDFEEMSNRLSELANNADLCERMGAIGRTNVLRNYSIEQRASEIYDLLCGCSRTR
ncbi:MAG: glycosyltransferase family 4 protein [Pseudomonadota bacterium]